MKTIIFKAKGTSEWEAYVPPPAPGYFGLKINVIQDSMAIHAFARMTKLSENGQKEPVHGKLFSWFSEQDLTCLLKGVKEGLKTPNEKLPKKDQLLLEWVGTRRWKLEDQDGNRISELGE